MQNNKKEECILEVPFYANTSGDGNQCYQVAMQSAIKYYLDKDVSAYELDRLTGRMNGKMTWTPQLVPVLYDFGLDVYYYTKTDVKPLLGGEQFIKSRYGKDAENVMRLTDVNALTSSAKILIDYGLYKVKVLDENEIKSHINDNHLPLILLDWNKVTGNTSFYQGHMGVLTGFNKDNFFFHQSGPANPKPNMPIPKQKLMEAWNANETDNDIVIVYGKR